MEPTIPSLEQPLTSNVKVITLGCRLNIYESEVMRQHAQASDLGDTVIINTCAVTNEAERQSRQVVRRAQRDNPHAKIVVTGCSAQLHPELYAKLPGIDLVLGNHEKMHVNAFDLTNMHERVRVNNIMEIKETAHHLVSGFENKVRAFVQIQNGCDHSCTFCSIPASRGKNRSVPIGAIADQIKLLLTQGCREVVLTGVDITGYGEDLPGQPNLGQLCKRLLAQVPDLQRLRLSSIDPAEIDETMLDLMIHEKRIMPHFHISLQAGDDMILKRMKRRHLRHHIIEFCNTIRAKRPDVVFGADIIAGFPTETDAMFAQTCDIVLQCNLTYLHTFPYSARANTPAARMPQVNGAIIKQRAAQLRLLGEQQLTKFYQNRIGKIEQVLIESRQKGYTQHFAPVTFDEDTSLECGQIVNVMITNATAMSLLGKICHD